jgi:hypothetical protein
MYPMLSRLKTLHDARDGIDPAGAKTLMLQGACYRPNDLAMLVRDAARPGLKSRATDEAARGDQQR